MYTMKTRTLSELLGTLNITTNTIVEHRSVLPGEAAMSNPTSPNILDKVREVLDHSNRLCLASSVDGNPSLYNSEFVSSDSGDELVLYIPISAESVTGQHLLYNRKVQVQIQDTSTTVDMAGWVEPVKDHSFLDGRLEDQANPNLGWYQLHPTKITVGRLDGGARQSITVDENKIGFFTEVKKSFQTRSKLWFRATRAPFFTATLVPVLLGSTIAWVDKGLFFWERFLIALVAGLFIHAGTNLINDFFDQGGDSYNKNVSPFNAGSQTIQSELMSSTKVGVSAFLCFGTGTVMVLYLQFLVGGVVLPILLFFGLFIAVFYTADPIRLSHHGLGEVANFLGYGPVLTLSCWFIHVGPNVPLEDFVLPGYWSVIPGLLLAQILLINEFQDYDADLLVGKRTLVVRISKDKAVFLYQLMTLVVYIWVLVGSLLFYKQALLAILAIGILPISLKAIKHMKANFREAMELIPANAMTVQVHLFVGLLVTAGVAITNVVM